jgi:hypothetical protein
MKLMVVTTIFLLGNFASAMDNNSKFELNLLQDIPVAAEYFQEIPQLNVVSNGSISIQDALKAVDDSSPKCILGKAIDEENIHASFFVIKDGVLNLKKGSRLLGLRSRVSSGVSNLKDQKRTMIQLDHVTIDLYASRDDLKTEERQRGDGKYIAFLDCTFNQTTSYDSYSLLTQTLPDESISKLNNILNPSMNLKMLSVK